MSRENRIRAAHGRARSRRAEVEALERRALLAGDVNVSIRLDSLMIQGDRFDNAVEIAPWASGGGIEVRGLDGTTINGATGPFRVSGQWNLRVRLGEGGDILRFGGDEGHGEGEVSILAEEDHEPGLILGSLDVDTGQGADRIDLRSVEILGKARIVTGEGDDQIDIGRGPGFGRHEHEANEMVAAAEAAPGGDDGHGGDGHGGDGGPRPDVRVGGTLMIDTGPGDDELKVAFARIGNALIIDTGSGDDTVVTGRGPIRGEHGDGGNDGGCDGDDGGGEGDDTGTPHTNRRPPDLRVLGGDIKIRTGAGSDLIVLRNTRGSGDLTVLTGQGADALGIQNLTIDGGAVIDTQQGDDLVQIVGSRLHGPVALSTGPGVDLIALDGSEFSGPLDVDTGSGDDALLAFKNMFLDVLGIDTAQGDDVVMFEGNTFLDTLRVDGGPGTDAVVGAPADHSTIIGHEADTSTFDVGAALDQLASAFALYWQGKPIRR